MRIESSSYLEGVYLAIAQKIGAAPEEAAIFAQSYIRADLTGHDTQGVAMFPVIVDQVRAGAIRFGQSATLVSEGVGYAVLDGTRVPGQISTAQAMRLAIEKANETTMGSVWIRNGNDTGMLSNYTEIALSHDMIGIAMNNTRARVAPWGGRDPIFGINPISYVIPAGTEEPIIFDGSTSSISGGALAAAAREGRTLASDYLVDTEGRMTSDTAGLVTGSYRRHTVTSSAIVPLGAKGFGWLLLVEIMTGLLSGGTISAKVAPFPSAERPRTSGVFVQAIDVGKLLPIDEFKARVDELIRLTIGSRLAEGFTEIRLPGARRRAVEERRRRTGIPIADHHWEALEQLATDVSVDLKMLRSSEATERKQP